MAAVTVTPANIRPALPALYVKSYQAGEALSVGDIVYIHTDQTLLKAVNTSAAAAQARGIVVSVGTFGATAAAIGDWCGVQLLGEVELGPDIELTIGAACFVSATAGKLDQTASATSGRFNYAFAYASRENAIMIGTVPVPVAVS